MKCNLFPHLHNTYLTHIFIMQLNDEHTKNLHSITKNPKGLHIIIGTLGSSKTFFMKHITQHFQLLGKNLLL